MKPLAWALGLVVLGLLGALLLGLENNRRVAQAIRQKEQVARRIQDSLQIYVSENNDRLPGENWGDHLFPKGDSPWRTKFGMRREFLHVPLSQVDENRPTFLEISTKSHLLAVFGITDVRGIPRDQLPKQVPLIRGDARRVELPQ